MVVLPVSQQVAELDSWEPSPLLCFTYPLPLAIFLQALYNLTFFPDFVGGETELQTAEGFYSWVFMAGLDGKPRLLETCPLSIPQFPSKPSETRGVPEAGHSIPPCRRMGIGCCF